MLPAHRIPKFRGLVYKTLAKNPEKKYVMDPTGEFHDHVIEWLQSKYKKGRKDWDIQCLAKLHYDYELQRYVEQVSYHPYVVVTALLNVHRKMMLWSDPTGWPRSGKDISLWQDLNDVMWMPLWIKIDNITGPNLQYRVDMLPELPEVEALDSHLDTVSEFGGSNGDQAFCLYLRHVADLTKITGSTVRLFDFRGPNTPRNVSKYFPNDRTLRFHGDKGENRGQRFRPPRDPLPMHPNTVNQLELQIWRRPGTEDDAIELDFEKFDVDSIPLGSDSGSSDDDSDDDSDDACSDDDDSD